MRTFREQFTECHDNGNCEVKKLKNPQVIDSLYYGPVKLNTMCWCKRFNYQCTSETCRSFRKSISLN